MIINITLEKFYCLLPARDAITKVVTDKTELLKYKGKA